MSETEGGWVDGCEVAQMIRDKDGWLKASFPPEVKDAIRSNLNRSRLAVYQDKDKQEAFVRAAEGVWLAVQHFPKDNRNAPDWPKLKNGQRFESHEFNRSCSVVIGLFMPWFRIFGRRPSGKENGIFFNVINDMMYALDGHQLSKNAMKAMLRQTNLG